MISTRWTQYTLRFRSIIIIIRPIIIIIIIIKAIYIAQDR